LGGKVVTSANPSRTSVSLNSSSPSQMNASVRPQRVDALDVELQPHPLALEPFFGVRGGSGREALDRLAGGDRLGRVDPDQTDRERLIVYLHLHRVAVHDPGDDQARRLRIGSRYRESAALDLGRQSAPPSISTC
jgi:hypothetical protein